MAGHSGIADRLFRRRHHDRGLRARQTRREGHDDEINGPQFQNGPHGAWLSSRVDHADCGPGMCLKRYCNAILSRTQNPPPLKACGFESHLRHTSAGFQSIRPVRNSASGPQLPDSRLLQDDVLNVRQRVS